MARPALSASRTAKIISLLSAQPDRAFSMADIVRQTGINAASCHAVLTALTAEGYLTKLPRDKRFILGPSLITAGQAALKAHPLIDRAQQAMEGLFRDLEVPIVLATIVGNDVLALSSIADRAGRTAGLKTGQRAPAVPHATLVFVAWSSKAEIDNLISKAGVKDKGLIQEWHKAIASVRDRGYQVTLREPDRVPLHELIAAMAPWKEFEFNDGSIGLFSPQGQRLTQPEHIDPDERYDVGMIAAPIFDRNEVVPLSMVLGGFARKLSGIEIERMADQLVRACLKVMRDQRADEAPLPA